MVIWFLLGLALVVALGAFATQGPGLRWAAAEVIRATTGCEPSFKAARLRFDGSLVIHDLMLRAPDVPGPGGDIVRADRVLVFLDWSRWRSGELRPTSVVVDGAIVRVSQSAEGKVNLTTLRAQIEPVSGPVPVSNEPMRLPFVTLHAGLIEVGEHTDQQFNLLGRMPVEGSITPIGHDTTSYKIELAEIAVVGAPRASAVRITGDVDVAKGTGDAKLEGLDLRAWTPEAVPLALRREWRSLALDGVIDGAAVHYDPANGLRGEITFRDIAISLPVPGEPGQNGNGSRVRMHGVSGEIRLLQQGPLKTATTMGNIEANLRGRIEDLPCEVNLRVSGLDPDAATVDCEIFSESFKMEKTSALRAFAPPLVLHRLEQFGGPTAVVDARVKVRRHDGQWTSRGSVLVRDGRAAFAQFPYPFMDITGSVEFDEESVRIVGLTGVGLTGAKLVAHGKIWPPSDGTDVRITIDVRDVPVDEVLAAAIDENRELGRAALWNADPTRLRGLAQRPADIYEFLLGADRAVELRGGEENWRGGLYKALFSQARYDVLEREGLVLSPANRAALNDERARLRADVDAAHAPERRAEIQSRLHEIERRLSAPDFEFGGKIERLVVNVTRAEATKGHYDTDIDIEFNAAGMVPEPFPLPIRAHGLKLQVREHAVSFAGEGFTSLRGGVASVSGSVDMTNLPDSARVPAMTIVAQGLPVDDLLIHAIPERRAPDDAAARDDEALLTASAPDILTALGISGVVDTTARIRQLDDGSAGYDVTVKLSGLTARPRAATAGLDAGPGVSLDSPESAGLMLSELHGTLHVTEQLLEVPELRGFIHAGADPATRGTFSAQASTQFADAAQQRPGSLAASVSAAGVNLQWPIEDLAAAFSGVAASRLLDLRREHDPRGMIDGEVRIEPAIGDAGADAGLRVLVGVSRADEVSFDILGGRLASRLLEGAVRVRIDPSAGNHEASTSVRFLNARLATTYEGAHAGGLTLDGIVGVNADGRLRPVGTLVVAIAEGAFESGLTRAVVSSGVSESLGRWMTRHELSGAFDADLRIAAAPERVSDRDSWSVDGTLTPRSFGLTRRGVRTQGAIERGRAVIAGREIRLEGLRAATPNWSTTVDGTLVLDEHAPAWTLNVALSGEGQSLEPTLLSLLPQAVSDAASATTLRVSGPWSMPVGRLMLAGLTDGAPEPTRAPSATGWRAVPPSEEESITRAAFEGELQFSQMSADVGVAITDATGRVVVDARLNEGAPAADVRLDITAPSLLVAGVPLSEAGAVIATGRSPGEVLAPTIFGRCADGSVSGAAWVRPQEQGDKKDFGARVELGGIRLGELLAGIDRARLGADLALGVVSGRATPSDTPAPPERGTLTAQIAIGGIVGKPDSRRGRGSLTIDGGDVVGVPLMAPMLELSNIIPPLGDKLNYMQAAFYLDGERLTFEDLRLQSSTVEVVGSGTMRTPGMELDLVFNSRGRARVPIWSDLFEGLRNEFITTTVKGTLRDPKFDSESLRGTRSLFSGLFEPRRPAARAADPAPVQAAAPTE
ncbi:MAG: hypothetical protein AB7K52_08100 [Phycisphaerales bacterium]